MATNLNNNLFQELFLYVPADKTQEFKQHSTDYKSYISFLEETHEIYVNGMPFGYNYDEQLEEIWNAIHTLQNEMLQLETDFNTHVDHVEETIQTYRDDMQNTITNYQTGVNNQIGQINNNITNLNTLMTQEGTARETLGNRLDAKDTQLETKNNQQDASINQINSSIGRENQSGSILYRIKQLENWRASNPWG